MTADEKRIAIAEACGWVWYRIPNSEKYSRGAMRALFLPAVHEYEGQSEAWLIRADGTERICNMDYMEREGHLPDYLNDLNAMQYVEDLLDDSRHDFGGTKGSLALYDQYCHELASRFGRSVRARASERAECFLRTIGKLT